MVDKLILYIVNLGLLTRCVTNSLCDLYLIRVLCSAASLLTLILVFQTRSHFCVRVLKCKCSFSGW
jgi:hypothetical protein